MLRVFGGESREAVAADLGISPARLTRWETLFMEGGQQALKKDAEVRAHGFLYRHRSQIAQWAFLILALLIATLFLTRFMTTGEGQ